MKRIINNSTYVSRAGYKLEQANTKFKVDFKNQRVLDIGSSSGGFSDYALKHGAKAVFAVELGTRQMSELVYTDTRVELHEKTDILNVLPFKNQREGLKLTFIPDIVLIDISFTSLRDILPHVMTLIDRHTKLIVLLKPQFEARDKAKQAGLIKNNSIRRQIFQQFELWARQYFVILNKSDAIISGSKGNKERFYLLIKNISS